ncbi:MAG: hypothetical protein ACRDZ2_15020 [Ilumatobacteraceae bacterium]
MAGELLYSEDADHALTALEVSAPADYERLAAALVDFETDLGGVRWKRRRYARPPVFGFLVSAPADTYLILWSSVKDAAIIEYVGPDI